VVVEAERVRDHVLHLARVLRRAVHVHRAALARDREGDLPLEVEVVLAARAQGAGQTVRRARERGGGVAPRDMDRRQHERLRRHRVLDRQDRRQRLEVELGEPRRASGRLDARRRDREDRLAREVHDAVGEDRVVVEDGSDVVHAGNVGRDDRVDDAGRREYRVEVDRPQSPVGDRRDADRRVQRAPGLGKVVDVGRVPRHVQRGRVVRQRRADDGAAFGEAEVGEREARVVHRGQYVATTCSTRVAAGALAPVSSQSLRIRLPSARRR